MPQKLKALRLFAHILLGLLLLIWTGAIWDNGNRRLKATKKWWLFRITQLLNMEIEVRGQAPAQGNAGLLFVSNHISWTDIPVIGGLIPLNFLSKEEVKKWPLIGRLAETSGTLFIRRGSGDTNSVARQMADYLGKGRSVLFFPEGTTSDGSSVSRFHRKLFRTCEYGDIRICPIAIHYAVDGCEGNPVAFIGDDEFTQHLWTLLTFDRIKVIVSILEPRMLDATRLDEQVNQIRQEIVAQVELFHSATTLNTNARWPDASSHAGRQDEVASF